MTLPTGPAVTFLFTDIEGSTRSERAVGSAAWAALVARHDALLRAAIEAAGGVVVKTEGDAFFAAFASPAGAVEAAVAAQRAVAGESWAGGLTLRVRMGLHLGEGRLREGRTPGDAEDYVGIDVNYAARIAAAANGGQIVLSDALVGALPRELGRIPGIGIVSLVDEGPRTVKDFDEPLPLHRLVVPGVADDDRSLRTTEVPSNLPGEVTPLVGREDEVSRLGESLRESRIVTLTGPGGSGKTRLGLAVARAARDRFPGGVWFVDLSAIRDPGLIGPAIAAAIDVRETPERTADEALRLHLRDRRALLVLDNVEQLLPDGAGVVAGLVRGAPELRVLATSRELLRISGERGHPVPPLGVEDGVALFVDRARARRPDLVLDAESLAAIRAISERLGGLPLAIELAAAPIRFLGPATILERLGRALDLGGGARDLPERQRTLRGAIAWSYELLGPEERRLFALLGVFASGWTAAAAAAVADFDGWLGLDVVEGLGSLADKSLVRIEADDPDAAGAVADPRFSLHPLLREFALERLADTSERTEVERRFAEVCVEIAESAGTGLLGATGPANLRRLDREDRNLRAAVDWAVDHDRPDLGLRIVGAAWRWYQQRGRLREARAILAGLLVRSPDADPRLRILGLAAEGGLAYWMNDFTAARAAYEERLGLAQATGDPGLRADAHYDLGFIGMVTQDGALLREHEQLALDLYLAAGREDAAVRARQALVLAIFLAGEYERARDLEHQNLEGFRRSESSFQIADSLTLLSAISWRIGDAATSWSHLLEAMRFWSGIDSAAGLARALGMAAIVQISNGDPELGARIAGAVYRLVREHGVMLAPVKVLHLPDPADLATERLGAERAAELMAEGEAIPAEDLASRLEALPAPSPGTIRERAGDG